MSYTVHHFVGGEKLYAAQLNEMDEEIKNTSDAIEGMGTAAQDAEAWAVGKRDGRNVPTTDPAYHNNSSYWAGQASASATAAAQSATSASNSATAAQTARTAAENAAQTAAEQVTAQVVDNWLEQHIDPQTGYALDDSLTSANSAAQAKKVGDEISDLKSTIETSNESITNGIEQLTDVDLFVFSKSGFYTTPAVGSVSVYRADNTMICCKHAVAPGETVTINATGGPNNYRLYAFLDNNDSVVARSDTNLSGEVTVDVPENAAYIVINNRIYYQPDGFYAYVGQPSLELIDTLIKVSSTQPEEETNRLWIHTPETEVQIPTYEEHTDLKDTTLKSTSVLNTNVNLAPSTLSTGRWNTDGTSDSVSAYRRTGMIPLESGIYYIECSIAGYDYYVRVWEEAENVYTCVDQTDYRTDPYYVHGGNARYLGLTFRKSGGTADGAEIKPYLKIFKLVDVFDSAAKTAYLVNAVGKEMPEYIYDSYITTSGTSVDITDVQPSTSHMTCAVMDASEGERFYVSGKGGSSARLWCFVNSSGAAIDPRAGNQAEQSVTLVAPAGASKLVVNFMPDVPYCVVKGGTVEDGLSAVSEGMDETRGMFSGILTSESFADNVEGKTYTITSGYWRVDTGGSGTGTHYAKTTKMTKFGGRAVRAKIGDGYKLSVRMWDSNGTFDSTKNTDYISEVMVNVPDGWSIAWNFINDSDTEITASDRETIASSFHIYTSGSINDTTFINRNLVLNSNDVVDFDLMTKQGRYELTDKQARTAVNGPSTYQGHLLVFVGTIGLQIYVNRFNTVYYRTSTASSVWTEWLRPLKPDTTFSVNGAAADARAVGGLQMHDGAVVKMTENPESIPVSNSTYGQNEVNYNDFISSTWDTLLPDNYQAGDAYNASTTKIVNVHVERESNWQSTPYGSNTDVYPIYRYTFTPINGYQRTVMLTSGCHGNEAEAYYGLYRVMRMIYFEGYKYPSLRYLRNVRFIVIPSWNPWGFQHFRRYNAFEADDRQAWNWLFGSTHQVDVDGTVYDISDVGEAKVIYDTMNLYDGVLDLWIDFHTDPYAGRVTRAGEIDDPRGSTPAYGPYGFTLRGTTLLNRLINNIETYHYILKNEYNFTSSPRFLTNVAPDASGDSGYAKWIASQSVPSVVVEFSTFMTGFPYASGSAGLMKLAQEYYATCLADFVGVNGW